MPIDIWCAFCESITDPALLERYRELLTQAERDQEARFHFAQDRRRYLITRALLRTTLSRYADLPPQRWTFTSNRYGRPAISNEGSREICFNLSHTRQLVVLAVARDRELGVDTEDVLTRRAPLEIAERFFASAEVASLRALPPERQSERFFQHWTLKESYIKARGMGLSLPLERFAFHFPRPDQVRLTIEPALQDDPGHWRFWQWWVQSMQAGGHDTLQRQHMLALCAWSKPDEAPRPELKEIIPLVSEGELPATLIAHS